MMKQIRNSLETFMQGGTVVGPFNVEMSEGQ